MIKYTNGEVYEDMRSLLQDITFEQARETCKEKGVTLGKEQYLRLGISDLSGLYTNVGLLLSDQCKHTIKVAVFADEAKTLIRDTKEFKGSVLKQLEDTYSYLMLCNQNRSQINGLNRIDHYDYPEVAIREALLNAIVHRDYAYSGSIIINITDKQMEYISIGGLVSGLTLADIGTGISQPRNHHLADFFHRLGFIEAYGTGVQKINEMYSDFEEPVRIEVTPNTFKMILPNKNERYQYHVEELEDGRIILEPRVLVSPFEISKNTLSMMDSSVKSLKQGRVSNPVDLSSYSSE